MATVNSAIQSLLDNLHNKMLSEQPLTAEEQSLVASAVDKLTRNVSLEQALVAVATEHLNNATDNMETAINDATSALSTVQSDIDSAQATIETQSANLSLVCSNVAGITRPVFGIKHIETPGNSSDKQRSQGVFAVYDKSGESYLVRPSYSAGTTQDENFRQEFLKINSNGTVKTTLQNHFVHASSFYAAPTTYIYQYGCSAILPLATSTNANDIAYEIIYSSQDGASSHSASYAGIYCNSATSATITKPKQNLNATDQWGISTLTNYNWNQVGVLYDNDKHCLVIVDAATSKLVEKYRDGNIATDISIANNAALQTHVNNGDFTVIRMIKHQFTHPHCKLKFNAANYSTNTTSAHDSFGFYGVLDTAQIGGSSYNAHYRFTPEKKLEPLNYHFCSSVAPGGYNAASYLANSMADLHVVITNATNHVLGSYHYQSKSDGTGKHIGYIGGALMCMNPYSNIGILNEYYTFSGTNLFHGIGRTCKAF